MSNFKFIDILPHTYFPWASPVPTIDDAAMYCLNPHGSEALHYRMYSDKHHCGVSEVQRRWVQHRA